MSMCPAETKRVGPDRILYVPGTIPEGLCYWFSATNAEVCSEILNYAIRLPVTVGVNIADDLRSPSPPGIKRASQQISLPPIAPTRHSLLDFFKRTLKVDFHKPTH